MSFTSKQLYALVATMFTTIVCCTISPAIAQTQEHPKQASQTTQQYQQLQQQLLPFEDDLDFSLAKKGLIKRPEQLEIKDDAGNVVWELGGYDFLINGKQYDSINPSLARQAKLNMEVGLYKVTDRIYQVRGYDLANMTFIKGNSGWIVFDTLLTPETAKAAFKLVTEELGEFPILAVIYSHAHADHFGGIKGIVSQFQVDSGEVEIIAPRDFIEHAVKENVLAGNAMTRRAIYQYGSTLPKSPQGQVDAAIGKGLSGGEIGLIAPSRIIEENEESIVIDGITLVFQNTPNTESPSEMNTYLPQFKALWTAENVIGSLHNVYTLRGAQTRDALGWSKYINQLIHHYGKDAEVIFASHSWPRWGNEYLIEVLEKQRDLYGYLHDQTLNLANKGVTINEIHNVLEVPETLSHEWYNRGYHGTYSHNVRAIINRYLGFFDMNPATLNKLSPADSGKHYVDAIGGTQRVLELAQTAFDNGQYRWGAELLNNLVMSQPDNALAKNLQADMLEQMGYQAESAGWRNAYLAAALELRNGISNTTPATKAGADFISAMSSELIFDFLGVKLDKNKAQGKSLTINMVFPDRNEKFLVELKNSHLNNIAGISSDKADVTVTMNRTDLDKMLMKVASFQQLTQSKSMQFDGDPMAFAGLLSMLEEFPFWFNIVTP